MELSRLNEINVKACFVSSNRDLFAENDDDDDDDEMSISCLYTKNDWKQFFQNNYAGNIPQLLSASAKDSKLRVELWLTLTNELKELNKFIRQSGCWKQVETSLGAEVLKWLNLTEGIVHTVYGDIFLGSSSSSIGERTDYSKVVKLLDYDEFMLQILHNKLNLKCKVICEQMAK